MIVYIIFINEFNDPFWKFKNQVTNSTMNKAELFLYWPISETSWWDDEVTPRHGRRY